jgi:hypothetical protein
MEQPKAKIKDIHGAYKDIPLKKITSIFWGKYGIEGFYVDFMNDNNSNDYLYFQNKFGVFVSVNRNLTAEIIFN